jgi:copper homeostasis protein
MKTSRDRPVLEVCCGSADFAVAASSAGADRVELCDNLVEGGTTPSLGATALAVERAAVPVMAMVRPRGGDFLYSDLEVEVMLRDIDALKAVGVSGLVFGMLRADGRVDAERTTRLLEVARPLPVTFHRAFDLSRNLFESLDVLMEIGVDRVLTSVGRRVVVEDLSLLGALVNHAAGRLTVLPGGGIRPDNVESVLSVPGVREVHVGASRRVESDMAHRVTGVPMGSAHDPDEYVREAADTAMIGALSMRLDAVRLPEHVAR